MKSIMYGLVFLLLAGFAAAASSPDFVYDGNGNKHVTYEDGGNVYYMFNDGSPELVSVGTAPAIDVDSNGNPHIAYVDGSVMYTTKGAEWSTPLTIGGDRTPDISVNPDDVVYIVFKNGGNSGQIQMAISPSFAVSTLESGNYEYQYYRYFWNPKIVTTADNYFVMYEHYYNYGYGSRAYTVYLKDAQGHSWSAPGQSSGLGYGKSPLTTLGDNPYFTYSYGGVIYAVTLQFNSENTVVGVSQPAQGTYPSIDLNEGSYAVTYENGGSVYLTLSNDLENDVLLGLGSKPVVKFGSPCVYFVDGDGAIASSCAEAEEEDSCVDADDDGYFAYDPETCVEGTDCNDDDATRWQVDYFYYDFDGDSFHKYGLSNMNDDDQIAVCYGNDIPEYYMEETLGRDCDDNNYDPENDCSEPCTDEDEDGYCDFEDCNDNNPNAWMTQVCFQDNDADGYNHWYGYQCYQGIGEFCYCGNGDVHEVCSLDYYPFTDAVPEGPDCNDDDATIHEGCGDISDVPEFGVVGAIVALMLVGLFVYRKR